MSERDTEEPGAYYVKKLLEEAAHVPVDEDPNYKVELPPFYDEAQFKRAQEFYAKNRMACFLSMLTGLLAVLAVPSVLDVLVETRNSSTPYTAYRRYIQTIFHIINWFRYDMKPGTPSWKSIEAVRKLHFNANRRCQKAGIGMISQKDMALTQFGFMGFVTCSPDFLGLKYTQEDLQAYCHFFRVIGFMLGTKDEFNLCSDSFETTLHNTRRVKGEIFAHYIGNPTKRFTEMTRTAVNGLWNVDPSLDYDALFYFISLMIGVPGYNYSLFGGTPIKTLKGLSIYSRISLWLMIFIHTYLLRLTVGRIFFNVKLLIMEFFMRYFPFLAFYQFRTFKDAYVRI